MRPYYNRRIGQDSAVPKLTLDEVSEQVSTSYDLLADRGFLQRSFGYDCVDAGTIQGVFGSSFQTQFYLSTNIRMPVSSVAGFIRTADEVGLFTAIEFIFDHVAAPSPGSGYRHDYGGCGWHFDPHRNRFDIPAAQQEWRDYVNRVLPYYDDGYELSATGEIVRRTPDGLADLVEAVPPAATGTTNASKIGNAVRTFRRGLSSREERKQAIRDLADVLEFYRPKVKTELLKEDERDLFNIANNYSIRHHREDQKDGYDGEWLTWLFYLYLSSVHLVVALVHGLPFAAPPPRPVPEEPLPTSSSDDDIPF